MPRNTEIDRVVSTVQQMLAPWATPNPHKLNGDAFVRQFILLSILSALHDVPAPEDSDGRAPMFGVNHAYDDEKAAPLIAHAISGDTNADIVLASVGAQFVRTGCVMPTRLRQYISRKLDAMAVTGKPWPEPHTKRRPRNANARRDFGITWAVSALLKDGFSLESGRALHSASSIVADALTNLGITLDDRRVARIWKANRKLADFFEEPSFCCRMPK